MNLSKRQKNIGIAYIEFKFTQSVPLAIGLSGQPLNGVPIIVQQSLAEKNRHAQMMETTRANLSKLGSGPIKVEFLLLRPSCQLKLGFPTHFGQLLVSLTMS